MNLKVCPPARYVLALFLFLTYTLLYCQRSILSVSILAMVNHTAIFNMQNETTSDECPNQTHSNITIGYEEGSYIWTQSTQGIILGSYFYGSVFAQLLGGSTTFLLGPKKVFVISTFVSSVFVLLTPFTADIGVIVISLFQIIVGLAQGISFHASFSLLARWSPVSEKTTLSSLSYSGIQVGNIVGLIATGYLCHYAGWPSSFYTFGACGLVLSLCLLFVIYDRPQNHPRISNKELIFLNENVANVASEDCKLSIPWKDILTSRAVWTVAFTKVCWGFGYYTILTKLPSYLQIILHFPIHENGVMNALVYALDVVTIILSGFMADFVRRRGWLSITNIRKLAEALGTIGPGLCILSIPFIGCNSINVILCLAFSMGFFGFCMAGDVAIVLDLAPDFSGILFGLTNGLSSITGIISPYVAGLILDKDQGDIVQWSYVFYLASSFYCLSAFVFLIAATAELQPWAITQSIEKKETKLEL
ncbi:sialin-like [Centruroides sculpturatus]|uniref:sialin-like n=1 Tax=Centruroides sculpturatus TaxID=218467 RepID=UPI000C6D9A38|nr:sialin-like [Centruroides sculpturatus]